MKKSTQSIILVLCMVLSLIYVQTNEEAASAASAPKLSKKSVTFDDVGDYKEITIKNVKSKNIKTVIRKSDNINVAGVDRGSAKNKFMVTSDGVGTATIKITIKLKKAINKKKTYTLKLKVTVKGEEETPTPSVEPSASATPSATPTVTPTAKPGDKLSAEEQTIYDKIIAKKSTYSQGMSYPNSTAYKWYAFHYSGNPESSTGTPITMNMTGSAALAAILNDAAFGAGTADLNVKVPNPGKKLNNPDPNTLRVGDVIKYWPDSKVYKIAIIIGKNSDQLLLVQTDAKEQITWEAFIPKTTKIEVAYSRYQTTAPSPSPTASATPSASATPTATLAPGFTEVSEEEQTAYTRMIGYQVQFPHGMDWTDNNKYNYSAFNGLVMDLGGAKAFAAYLSDVAFNGDVTNHPARQVDRPAATTIRIGDIIFFASASRTAMVVGRDDKNFKIAEGNVGGKISWNGTLATNAVIDYMWTRW